MITINPICMIPGKGFYLQFVAMTVLLLLLNCSCDREEPDVVAPSAPSGLTASTSTNSVILSWTASTDNVGVSGYKIFRDNKEVGKSISTTYTDVNLISNTSYTYTVKAFDAVGNISSASQAHTVKTADDCPTCSKWLVETPTFVSPSNLNVITAGESKSAGTLILKNADNLNHSANLTLTFSGAGSTAVDSFVYKVGSTAFRKKVENNVVVLENIAIAAKATANIDLTYKIKSPIPSNVSDQSQISLALTSLTTDEAGVIQPGSKTFPAMVNLDKLYVPKLSTYIRDIQIEYKDAFAIIGNAVSNELAITITSSANVDKTVTSLTANFGENGKAVKMLRYLDADGKWVVLKADDGEIVFSNLSLKSGINTLKCYFSLKPETGVANNAKLDFIFTKLNDGEGGQVPASGKLPKSLNVGLVNSDTQATVVTSEWIGAMRQAIMFMSPTGTADPLVYQVGNLMISGSVGARFQSIRLKDPYVSLNMLAWHNSGWAINFFGPDYKILAADVNWNSDYVTLKNLPPASNNLKVGTYNHISIGASIRNTSSTEIFNSDTITPGLFGLELVSKYDIVLLNSNGQVIDMSDVVVKQGRKILEN